MNNAINMLPCPMCGCSSINVKNEQPTDNSGGYFIECPDCGISTSLRYACGDDPIPLLAEQWNRRATAQCLHQIAEPAAPVVKPIKDAIDAVVMAAFTEGGCSEHRMSEARIQTELRKKELRTLLSTPQPCSRSHPHEEMTPMCELRTEIARLTNALARAEAQLAAAPQAVQPVAPQLKANCYSDDNGDYWRDCPDDCDFVEGLKVGDTYELQASIRAWSETFRVTKAPDETSDDYEVELVSSDAPAHPAEGVPAPFSASGIAPCPLCGSESKHVKSGEGSGHRILCWNDDCECSSGYFSSKEDAIASWNSRAALAATQLAPFAEVLTDEDMEDFVNTHGFTGDFQSMARIVEATVLEKIAATQPAAQGLEQDAERWGEVLRHVGAAPHFGGQHFTLNTLQAPDSALGFKANLMSGSVAQHFTKAIDAERAAQAKQGGAA